MTKTEFQNEIAIIIEGDLDSVAMDDQLGSLSGWDSLAIIGFIAMVDAKFGVALNISQLAECKTVGDLAKLLGGKVD